MSVENLHKQCSGLESRELIQLLNQLYMLQTQVDERVYKIMNTYLVRALIKEGYR